MAGYGVRVMPQPAADRVELEIEAPVGSGVSVEVVDGSGRFVGTLWEGVVSRSGQRVEADCSGMATGLYRCVLRSGRYRVSAPLVIVR